MKFRNTKKVRRINSINEIESTDEMREKYKKCCSKKLFGLKKNSSPYCKELENRYKNIIMDNNNEIKQELEETPQPTISYGPPKKTWHKLWGGKKSKSKKNKTKKRNKYLKK